MLVYKIPPRDGQSKPRKKKLRLTSLASFQILSSPYYFVVIILVLFPVLFIAGNSLLEINPHSKMYFFSLQNYIRFFTEDGHIALKALLRSLYYASIATFISLIVGYPFAYYLAKLKARKRELLMLLINAPMWINMTLRIYGWKPILDSDGYISTFLYKMGFGVVNLTTNGIAMIIGLIYIYLPFMIIPIYTSLVKIEKSHLEASHDLGGTPFDTFAYVTLPLSIPGVLSGITMVLLPTATSILVPHYLFNPVNQGSGQLIGQIIEERFLRGGDYGFGSAISLILALIISVMVILTKRFDKYTAIVEKDR